GLDHPKLGTLEHQPRPAASELRDGIVGQFLLAGIDAAEYLFHFLLERRWRFAAPLRLEATPVKTVIPRLRRVVEDVRAVGPARGHDHDLIERQIGQLS